MSITIDILREISLPFPSFQPNTIISSEQVNDNNDEIQYRTNLLIKSYLKHVLSTKEFEDTFNAHVQTYNTFVTETGENFVDVRRVADENKTYLKNYIDTINTAIGNRITNEVLALNELINTNKVSINSKVDTIKTETNNKIDTLKTETNTKIDNIKTETDARIAKKGDTLELRNTLLYLKSGNSTISIADLAGLGGGGTMTSANIATGKPVNKSDWTLDESKGLYHITFEHRLNTPTPLVVYFNDETGFNVFDVIERIDSNNVKIFTDVPIDTYMSVINGSSKIELVQALLDDDNITPLRTWSSEKIENSKIDIVVTDDASVPRKDKTFYFVVTDKQSNGGGSIPSEDIRVSPNMGIRLV